MCLNQVKAQLQTDVQMNSQETMMDGEFRIVKVKVHEILTEDTSRQRATMNNTIS